MNWGGEQVEGTVQNKHTISDLYQMQMLPLSAKIRMTEHRIRAWVDEYGIDGVYVSFSGGKDSTVLLDIARRLYPEIKAVFVDTGLEYPEIRQFVKRFNNVDWLKPRITFMQVIEKYGYPFISKEVSECVYGAKKFLARGGYRLFYRKGCGSGEGQKEEVSVRVQQTHGTWKVCADQRVGGQTTSIESLGDWESIPVRAKILFGIMTKGNIPSGARSRFSCERYKFFLEDGAPEISSECCKVMKKAPVHTYTRRTGRKPITAQMASESRLRTQQWLKNGCNGFDMKSPISNPMSFWTEQDVLMYIRNAQDEYDRNLRLCNMKVGSARERRKRKECRKWVRNHQRLEICSVYGRIVSDDEESGQMTIYDMDSGIFDLERPTLYTTGCERTGCMFCGYGCHLEKSPNRFEKMKVTHPKQYEYIMKPKEKGGLGYKEVIDWINEHGGLNIRY